MGFHHKSTGRNNHHPYRWTVADDTAREAITTNADGTSITDTDGLYCKCYQTDDDTEWIIIDTDPLTWEQMGGGGGVVGADYIGNMVFS